MSEKPVHYFRTFTGPEALCGAAQIDSQRRTLMARYMTCAECLHALEPDEDVLRMLSEGCKNDPPANPAPVSGEVLERLAEEVVIHREYGYRIKAEACADLLALIEEVKRSRPLIGQLSGKLAECSEKLAKASERDAGEAGELRRRVGELAASHERQAAIYAGDDYSTASPHLAPAHEQFARDLRGLLAPIQV